MVTIRSMLNCPRECPVIKTHFAGTGGMRREGTTQTPLTTNSTDFDAFYGVTERARAELEPIKKIKNKNDVSLYFLLRVCVSSKFVSTLQGRWTLDLLTPWPRPHWPLTAAFDPSDLIHFWPLTRFIFDPASEYLNISAPEVTTRPAEKRTDRI